MLNTLEILNKRTIANCYDGSGEVQSRNQATSPTLNSVPQRWSPRIDTILRAIFAALCILYLLITGCSKGDHLIGPHGQSVETYRSESEVYQFYRNGNDIIKHGSYERYESGRLVEKSTYYDGQLNGQSILYYSSGHEKEVRQYDSGILNGPYNTYYEDGTKKSTGHYTQGIEDGRWTKYNEDGTTLADGLYKYGKPYDGSFFVAFNKFQDEFVTLKDGVRNGIYIRYYANGSVEVESTYENGKPVDVITFYYQDRGVQQKIFVLSDSSVFPFTKVQNFSIDGKLTSEWIVLPSGSTKEITYRDDGSVEDIMYRAAETNAWDIRVYPAPNGTPLSIWVYRQTDDGPERSEVIDCTMAPDRCSELILQREK